MFQELTSQIGRIGSNVSFESIFHTDNDFKGIGNFRLYMSNYMLNEGKVTLGGEVLRQTKNALVSCSFRSSHWMPSCACCYGWLDSLLESLSSMQRYIVQLFPDSPGSAFVPPFVGRSYQCIIFCRPAQFIRTDWNNRAIIINIDN